MPVFTVITIQWCRLSKVSVSLYNSLVPKLHSPVVVFTSYKKRLPRNEATIANSGYATLLSYSVTSFPLV